MRKVRPNRMPATSAIGGERKPLANIRRARMKRIFEATVIQFAICGRLR
jgi:hypothetical protein